MTASVVDIVAVARLLSPTSTLTVTPSTGGASSFSGLTGRWSLAQVDNSSNTGIKFLRDDGTWQTIDLSAYETSAHAASTYATIASLSGTGYLHGAAGFVTFVTAVPVSDLSGVAAWSPTFTGLTLSGLGAGFVRSSSGGALSSSAFALADIPSGTGYLKGSGGAPAYTATIARADLANAGGAIGDLWYWDGSNMVRLAAVASGSALVSAGVTTAPAWSTGPTLTGTLTAGALTTSGALSAGAATVTSLDAGSGTITTTGHMDPGATGTGRSTIGDIRFGQATARTLLGIRKNDNSADVAVISTDASNNVFFGGTGTNTLAPGVSQLVGVAGVVLKQASTALVTANTSQIQLNITPLSFAQGLSSPKIEHATQPADNACTDLTVIAQAPFASAATNKNSGNLLLKTAAPVAGGTAGSVKLQPNGSTVIEAGDAKIGFYGTAAGAKPTITGSRAGNAALADLLTKLAALGLITDSTSA